MIERMAQWELVRYIGSLINPKTLGKRLDKIMELYETNSFMQAAKSLIIWVIVIIAVCTIIDLVFYWLRPEQKNRLMQIKETVIRYKDMIVNRHERKPRR